MTFQFSVIHLTQQSYLTEIHCDVLNLMEVFVNCYMVLIVNCSLLVNLYSILLLFERYVEHMLFLYQQHPPSFKKPPFLNFFTYSVGKRNNCKTRLRSSEFINVNVETLGLLAQCCFRYIPNKKGNVCVYMQNTYLFID